MKKYLRFRGVAPTSPQDYLLPVNRISFIQADNGGAGDTEIRFYMEPTNSQYVAMNFAPAFDTEKWDFIQFLNDEIKDLCRTGNRNVVKDIGDVEGTGTINWKDSSGVVHECSFVDINRG